MPTIRLLPANSEREQSHAEELANSISHGVGLSAALVGIPILLVSTARHGGAAFIVGTSIFSASILLLYLASTIYHALPIGKAKRVFKILDHSSIFILIAGTYTPFTLGVLRGAWGWVLLWDRLGPSGGRRGTQNAGQDVAPHFIHGPLLVDGVDCRHRGRPTICQNAHRRLALVACGWLILYGWCHLLRRRLAVAVWSFHMAFVRSFRYCMPLLRPSPCFGMRLKQSLH